MATIVALTLFAGCGTSHTTATSPSTTKPSPSASPRPAAASLSSQLQRVALACSDAPRVMPPGPPNSPAFTLFAQQIVARAQALAQTFSAASLSAGGSSSTLGMRLAPLQAATSSVLHLAEATERTNDQGALAEILTQTVAAVDVRAHQAMIPGCGMLVLAG